MVPSAEVHIDYWVEVAIMLPVVAGVLFCIWELRAIAKVSLARQKDDGCLDRALLDHREAQLEQMKFISSLIADGSVTFLATEYSYLAVFVVSFAWAVGAAAGFYAAVAFVTGCLASSLAGYIGIKIATYANSRTTHQSWLSLTDGYDVAIRGGCIASFSLVSIGISSLFALIKLFHAVGPWEGDELWAQLASFAFGVSSIGLFARVGGGIFTKAADIGADLSGKVEFGLMEDDYRNPACIADNVGDNVGGVVGIGADLFGSLAGSACAALVIAGNGMNLHCETGTKGIAGNWRAMMFPLIIPSSGIATAMVVMAVVRLFYHVREVADAERALRGLIIGGTLLETPVVFVLAHWCLPEVFAISCDYPQVTPTDCAICVWLGLWSGLVIGHVTEYYTSYRHSPVREIAAAQEVSAGSGVIFGLASGYMSCAAPAFFLAMTALVAHSLVGPYGVALAALGMLSVMPLSLAVDAYDSIADNAEGIAEMSGLGADSAHTITDVLGGAGAIGNGFAVGSSALVCLALLHAFWLRAHVQAFDAVDRWYFTGLMLGAMLPYVFSAITMRAVGRAATDMAEECRRQFPGIINNYTKPDYDRCIRISTQASLKEMGPAGLMVIGAPVLAGLLFGKRCTAGLLQGALVSGVQMAISMINTGGAWDNSKKYVAMKGDKDTEQHRNAVIGDIVGDPLKDVSGPSLNVLLNLSAITSVVFGSFIGSFSGPDGSPFWLRSDGSLAWPWAAG